jgi:hypothetical protein
MIIQTSLGSEYVPPRIGEVAISRRRPGRFCRDLECIRCLEPRRTCKGATGYSSTSTTGTPSTTQCYGLFFLVLWHLVGLWTFIPWLWRNSAHRERSKLTWKLAELTGGSGIVRTACRYLVLNGVPFGKALVLPMTAALTCYEAGLVAMLETTRLKTTICKNRFTAKNFDDNSTKTVFLGRQPLFHIPLYSFALSPFPCARFGSSYSRIGIRLWGG